MLASAAPAPAAAVGYTTETYGPMVLGTNWFKMAFNGVDPNATGVTQNADGSIHIAGGGGDHYNAQLERIPVRLHNRHERRN